MVNKDLNNKVDKKTYINWMSLKWEDINNQILPNKSFNTAINRTKKLGMSRINS